MNIKELRKIIRDDVIVYEENQTYWAEFRVRGIPYRVSINGELETRASGFYQYGPRLKHWRARAAQKGTTDKCGGWYFSVSIGGKNIRLHQLVAICFLGEMEDGMEVDHIDGDRSNNKASNLKICTHQDNMAGAKNRGAWKKGSRLDGKITMNCLLDICERMNAGESNAKISRHYRVDASNISKIRHGHIFSDITADILNEEVRTKYVRKAKK